MSSVSQQKKYTLPMVSQQKKYTFPAKEVLSPPGAKMRFLLEDIREKCERIKLALNKEDVNVHSAKSSVRHFAWLLFQTLETDFLAPITHKLDSMEAKLLLLEAKFREQCKPFIMEGMLQTLLSEYMDIVREIEGRGQPGRSLEPREEGVVAPASADHRRDEGPLVVSAAEAGAGGSSSSCSLAVLVSEQRGSRAAPASEKKKMIIRLPDGAAEGPESRTTKRRSSLNNLKFKKTAGGAGSVVGGSGPHVVPGGTRRTESGGRQSPADTTEPGGRLEAASQPPTSSRLQCRRNPAAAPGAASGVATSAPESLPFR